MLRAWLKCGVQCACNAFTTYSDNVVVYEPMLRVAIWPLEKSRLLNSLVFRFGFVEISEFSVSSDFSSDSVCGLVKSCDVPECGLGRRSFPIRKPLRWQWTNHGTPSPFTPSAGSGRFQIPSPLQLVVDESQGLWHVCYLRIPGTCRLHPSLHQCSAWRQRLVWVNNLPRDVTKSGTNTLVWW